MTTSLSLATLLGTSLLGTHLARTIALFAVSYLALRRSTPNERTEILKALSPVLMSHPPDLD
jgi:hypothetical protein